MPSSLSIAFIGAGVMGRSMAGHLLRAGHRLHVHSRTREKAESLLEAGAVWHASAGEAAAEAEVVITMLGYPTDVEEVYMGKGGILERTPAGSLLIDMTTSSPLLARKIAEAAAVRSLGALDAPVSGGDIGAREARLVIMVGGDQSWFERALPVLQQLGKNIALHGGPGAGQQCKIANQISVAVGMVAWCEALAFATRAGLDPVAVHQSICGGAAGSWALTNLAPRALGGDFSPGFYVKHMLKDVRIAVECAEEMGFEVPGLRQAKELYEKVVLRGWEESGTQALFKLYLES